MNFIKVKTLVASSILIATATATQAKDIKVAIVGAMSGPVAQYGDMQFAGAKQAIEDINSLGGINGDKLVAVEYDDMCDPKQAVAVANKVVNDGVHYVIGHLCSSSTQPASDIYEDEGILMITPAATNPELTERDYKLVMRTTGLDSDQSPTAAHYVINTLKPKRIAVIHDRQQYGEGLARLFRDEIVKAGLNVVMFEGVSAGDKDFSSLIAKLNRENIDFAYFGGYHPEMGQILRQSKQVGLKTQFMGPEGLGNVSLTNIAGDAAEGLLVTMPKRYDQLPENKAVVDALLAKKQDTTGAFVWTSYAAVQSLAQGMAKSKSQDPETISAYLKKYGADTVMGHLTWNEAGDLKGFEFGIFRWQADGSSTLIK